MSEFLYSLRQRNQEIFNYIRNNSFLFQIIFLAILKEQGHNISYFEGNLPGKEENFNLILVYGTVVDFRNENRVCKLLKERFHYGIMDFPIRLHT